MNVLNEIRFNDSRIILKEHIVRSPILPKVSSELERDVVVQGECVIEGAVFARNFEVQQGPLRVMGCLYTQLELHVNSDATGTAIFEKAVGSSNAIVSLAPACRTYFLADVSAKQVKLRNAYIAANIFADEIILEDCVVIGGVFATRSLELNDCVVGTFNSSVVRASKSVYLLFPSAFSVEKMNFLPGTELFSLTLADLGALMSGTTEAENTGKIPINIAQDEVKTVLSAEGIQQILRTYSVVGKVLSAGLVDYEKLQNQFLISCASMGNQLLKTYDIGLDRNGKPIDLTAEHIAEFFFGILHGSIQVSKISGEFDLASIVSGLTPSNSVETTIATDTEPSAPRTSPTATVTPVVAAAESEQPLGVSYETVLPTLSVEELTSPQEAHSAIDKSIVPDMESLPTEQKAEPKSEPDNEDNSQVAVAHSADTPTDSGTAKNFCQQCGTAVEEGCAFCGECGMPQNQT